jgi:hypothetical protein
MFRDISKRNMYQQNACRNFKRKTVQTPFPAAVSTANPSIDLLSHITALEGNSDITISLNMDVMNSESFEKTA